MSFIEELAAKRRKLLDGLVANEGDINLRIFEDFYPDEAHFIFELLQNAEDVGATEAEFELTAEACTFEHNGTRHFDERDIKSITGIFNSSKERNPDQIGKFGVGFKSVFVYTETPIVYSRDYCFRISQLVLPETVPKPLGLTDRTRFAIPFNNSKKAAKQAYDEIHAGLNDLSQRTLLFLKHLTRISWHIGKNHGAILRRKLSDNHFEVLKTADGRQVASSHYLRFNAPVKELERQTVAVAYELAFLGDEKEFDVEKPLSQQLKIVPADPGRVAVFFPAEKETSGLRFHLHAPFVPELSRASIKNTPLNRPLFEQLAKLVARSLHGIKELGLMTGEFLAVLPNKDDALPERYILIRRACVEEMQEQPLMPTYRKGYAPAKTLVQSRAVLKELLEDNDLTFLLGRDDSPTWSISATQRNSNVDHFLNSLGIEDWDVQTFVKLVASKATDRTYPWQPPINAEFMTWLGAKSDEWHQQFYAVLFRILADDDNFSELLKARIVRRTDGSYSAGAGTYFLMEMASSADPFPRVDSAILLAGNKQKQQHDALSFLQKIGVRQVGETEQIDLLLKNRYSLEALRANTPSDKTYLADLKRFIAFLDKNPAEKAKFATSYILMVDVDVRKWATPGSVYLDLPFLDTGLRFYHEALNKENRKRWALSNWYSSADIDVVPLIQFAKTVGCSATFSEFIEATSCSKNPKWAYLSGVDGVNYTSPIDRDFTTSDFICSLLKSKQVDFSRLVWRTMCSPPIACLWATYRINKSSGQRQAESTLIYILRQAEWIPQDAGRFVLPKDASREQLPSGFAFDTAFDWLRLVHFGEDEGKVSTERDARAEKRVELGFKTEDDLERAKALVELLPIEEQNRLIEDYRRKKSGPPEEFPERPVRNRELRNKRIRDQATDTPEKESETRQRTVSVGYETVKAEAKLYLQEQYTNDNGVMFCQICEAELPFRLPNGSYYFEAVESVCGLDKRFRETFLALCPNHSAMFQYANEDTNRMQELLEAAVGERIEVTLAETPATIVFTEAHIADIKACLESLELESDPPV